MRRNLDAYTNRGRSPTDYEKMGVRLLYDIGCELERIADALEDERGGA